MRDTRTETCLWRLSRCAMRDAGVLVRAFGPELVAVCPPLTVTQEHVGLIGDAYVEAVSALGACV